MFFLVLLNYDKIKRWQYRLFKINKKLLKVTVPIEDEFYCINNLELGLWSFSAVFFLLSDFGLRFINVVYGL